MIVTGMGHTSSASSKPALLCGYYDDQPPASADMNATFRQNGTLLERCPLPEDGKRVHCYASWMNTSGEAVLMKKGCWLNHENCYNKTKCLDTSTKPDIHFCCCDGNLCNEVFAYIPGPVDETPEPSEY